MDESGVYDDIGTRGDQPTTEGSRPEGGGVKSGNAAGRNKPDPVSAGPQLGNTIAGRPPETITHGPLGNAAAGTTLSAGTGESQSGSSGQAGSPDTGARGVTGQHGSSPSAAHATPDTDVTADGEQSGVVTSPQEE